ncbi:MAG: tyrosine-type recombinase/integrase [Symploca sp. SIO2G7]|nr:tyrosine-type recombinase/integrase [Symploca sp. SIO2G7]
MGIKFVPKAPKGTVAIQGFKGRLRLRWSYQGKRYCLYVELPDTPINRKAAEIKARQIELDIISGNLDKTLVKYKLQKESSITLALLFSKFTEYKAKKVYSRTLDKYKGLAKHIQSFFGNKSANLVKEKDAENFAEWLGEALTPSTVKERVGLLKACYDWGLKQKLVTENPWEDITVRIPPKQRPNPFSRKEVAAILNGFRNHPKYNYYADYVEFLLGTGCRISEAIGLRWKQCKPDCTGCWISETLTRGIRKETKTGRDRYLPLTPHLTQVLLNRKDDSAQAEDLVFTTPQGNPIDDHNFRNRAWKKILNQLNIEYRKPYACRATFVSHALDAGMNPVDVAELTGHNVRTLYEHYAGSIQSRPKLPELYKT